MDNLFKRFVVLILILFAIALILMVYNNNTTKKAIEAATNAVGEVFQGKAEYSKETNRIIVEKYLKNEEELLKLTRDALPKLSTIGDYDIVELLSVRAYYSDTKENFQFYDIKFRDISKLNWDGINNFDDFLIYLNTKLD